LDGKQQAEAVILEMQGTLEFPPEVSNAELELGELAFSGDTKASLTIGNHVLDGKRVKLDKPLLLLEVKPNLDGGDYRISTVIREKILFSSRPKHFVDSEHRGRIRI
jgi:chromosome transmission fidelity protein 8